ncbi:MAG TPA: hypothetical protein VK059_10920 [Nocardioidaceae bacterium]|nr:hypothetical protein [Nocardioidaceae bacterium]
MTRTADRLRRSAAALAGVACLLAMSACGTNFGAQTNQVYQPASGADAYTDELKLLNVLAVDNADDTATLSATLVNRTGTDDSVTAVSGTDGEGNDIDVQLVDPVEIPAHGRVKTGEEAQIVVSSDDLTAGYYVNLDFTFENSSPTKVDVPIVTRNEEGVYADAYTDIAEAPEQTPKQQKGERKQSGNDQG